MKVYRYTNLTKLCIRSTYQSLHLVAFNFYCTLFLLLSDILSNEYEWIWMNEWIRYCYHWKHNYWRSYAWCMMNTRTNKYLKTNKGKKLQHNSKNLYVKIGLVWTQLIYSIMIIMTLLYRTEQKLPLISWIFNWVKVHLFISDFVFFREPIHVCLK